jgi:hypothetical protein
VQLPPNALGGSSLAALDPQHVEHTDQVAEGQRTIAGHHDRSNSRDAAGAVLRRPEEQKPFVAWQDTDSAGRLKLRGTFHSFPPIIRASSIVGGSFADHVRMTPDLDRGVTLSALRHRSQ